jgi:transcriptional regulator with XRE-family HTH domain
MSFRTVKGELIRKKRGERSLKEIAELSGNKFTRGAIFQWEKGDYKPTDDNIPYLLKALDCSYEDISEPVDMAVTV